MRREALKATIETWADENHVSVSDEQIGELMEGIEIADQMYRQTGYAVGQIQTKERAEIERLNKRIDLLRRFIASKGYQITVHDGKITRTHFENYADRAYTVEETFT